MKRTVPIFAVFLAVLTAGCAARTVQKPAAGTVTAPPQDPSAAPSFTPPPSVEDEMRRKKTIGELWTAMNKHHDALGRLLQVRRTGTVVMGLRGDRDEIEGARRRLYKVKTGARRVTVRRPRVALQTKPTPTLKKPAKGRVGAGDAARVKAKTETRKRRKFRVRYSYRRRPIRVCRRVCRHVKAICYASTRICRIASRLGELPAMLACKRSALRCVDSRKSARKYCPPCR